MRGVDRRRGARDRPGRRRRAVDRRRRGGRRRTGWPRCTAPRPTSASSATRSAAAWAGTPASWAWPRTASRRSRSSPPTARLVRADAETETDLFWAVRGGGGNFGVVTALEFRLYPIETAYAGMLVWDRADADKVLRAWARWAATAPDAVTTSFRILQLPPFEEIPAPVRGRQLVVIDGAVLGDDDGGRGDPRRAARARARDGHLRPGAGGVAGAPAHGPRGPDARRHAHHRARRAARRGDRRVPRHGRRTAREQTLLAAELRQLGGALGRPHAGRRRTAACWTASSCSSASRIAATPGDGCRRARPTPSALVAAMAPWANGRQYLNFLEHAGTPHRLRRGVVRPAAVAARRAGPRRNLRGQPPDRRRADHVPGPALTPDRWTAGMHQRIPGVQ